MRVHYAQSINELDASLKLSPDDPLIYANMASAYAQLGRRPETYKYIQLAEQEAVDQSAILLATGDALLTLGDRRRGVGAVHTRAGRARRQSR